MEDHYLIAILSSRLTLLERALDKHYIVRRYQSPSELKDNLDDTLKLIVLDFSQGYESDLELLSQLRSAGLEETIPVLTLYGEGLENAKVAAFEAGYDDFIDANIDETELALRCERLIYNKIANDQLHARVQQANDLAFIAMSDTSDLGVNIQFLLDAHQCTNMDELGMRLLQAINSYGLKASLQLRGALQVKNMEFNGMAKELESTLLWELQDGGRYVDFGKRSVMNYEQVSILVKNMPENDENKYGAIKDNVFSLLQGANARVKVLDNLQQIKEQQSMVSKLATKMQSMMTSIDEGYQEVMKDTADVVENMADQINTAIINLALHEEHEKALEAVMDYGIKATNQIFSKGLQLDENFHELIKELGNFLAGGPENLSSAQRARILELLENSE